MARLTERLTARACRRASRRGLHPDGRGLYLNVAKGGSKSWIYRYEADSKRHDLGLGPYPEVGLAKAREEAMKLTQLRLGGGNPLVTRRRAGHRPETPTFQWCVERYVEANKAGWRSGKYAHDWEQSLVTHAYPVLGRVPVNMIDLGLVMQVIEPHWATQARLMSQVRARIETVIDWAVVRGYRQGPNPARWKGHIEALLPEKGKVAQVEHFAALPHIEMPVFMARLRAEDSVVARVLEFAVLTAARAGEARGATWQEIDLEGRQWRIPARRMKTHRPHVVPLSDAVIALLQQMAAGRRGELVFPRPESDGPLPERSMLDLLGRLMPGQKLTVHGFRSSLRDWAAECTAVPSEVAELALSHKVGSKVEQSYRRSDMFEKRRQLAETWARYLDGTPGDVVALSRRSA